MKEAHIKPCYMLEYPKADGTSQVTIRSDEVKTEMDNQQVTQLEIGWISGIIDGEGYLGITWYQNKRRGTKSVSVELHICNTDEKIIDKYVNIVRRIGVNPYIKECNYGGKNNRKKVWKATIHRMSTLKKVLDVVNPYLTGNKKIRGDLIFEFINSRIKTYTIVSGTNIPYTKRELEIICECLKLQKRGTSETIRKAELYMHQRQAEITIEERVKRAWLLVKLHKEGKSKSEIARILGYPDPYKSKNTIAWFLRKLKNNELAIQKLGYFPQYSDDIVRSYVKA